MNKIWVKIITGIALAFILCGIVSASDLCISDIHISGNKKTKDFTILRELPFRKGDAVELNELIKKIEVAKEHLDNTSLFNYVFIHYFPDTLMNHSADCLPVIIYINVEERWYIWPQVSLKLEDRNLSSWLKERDWNRITIGWGARIYNVFGVRHKITASHYFGYEKGGRLGYTNIALDKERTQMLGFNVMALYNRTLNTQSMNNKVIYVKDVNDFIDRTVAGGLSYTYRPGIRATHTINADYSWTHIGDTVLELNKNYWGTDNVTNNSFRLSYIFNYEHRDYFAYPTKGYFIGAELTGETADEMKFFFASLNVKLQYYKEILPRLYWSSRLNTTVSFKNKEAYIYDRFTGYEDRMLTGYDYYVVDGQHNILINNDLRYAIMPKKIVNLSFIRGLSNFKKIHFSLYAKVMCDFGYVHNSYAHPTNTLANTFLYGYGVGLDLVTYYDIVLNASYAFNKMGECGFFFGIKAPIF
jgi:outer membrane protein assembly factor BamA